MALPDNGLFGAIAGKKSLPTIEVAPARRSCIGSPQRRVASRVAEPRALSDARARGDIDVNTVPDLDKATALVPGITNRYCSPSFETATEPVIGRAFARPVRW